MEAAAILKLVDTILGLAAAGIMTVQRAREVFQALDLRLTTIHAEGRTMSAEEFRAFLAQGDDDVRAALANIDEILAQLG